MKDLEKVLEVLNKVIRASLITPEQLSENIKRFFKPKQEESQ